MIQLALLVFAASLGFAGIKALRGDEKPGEKTSKGVAIATLVFSAVLAVFALVFPFLVLP